jgi:tRNA pseudouridine38-40 synthase
MGGNRLLPPNVAILEAEEVPLYFHARFSATGKKYSYDFLVSPVRHPFYVWNTWWVGGKLNWDNVLRSLPYLEGEKDFASFRSLGSDEKSSVRRIISAKITEPNPLIKRLELTASGFLRHMARTLAGTVWEIARGRIKPTDFPKIIEAKNRSLAGMAAPPQGLCLREVYYTPL